MSFSKIYSDNIKINVNAKLAYPVDFGKKQLDYFSLNPVYELKLDIPVYKTLGINASADFLTGYFQEKPVFGKFKVGNYQFYSFFVGIFYRINLSDTFSIRPDIKVGYSYIDMKLDTGNQHNESILSIQTSVDLEKKISEHWALDGIISFGYYDIYCPLAAGIGVSYNF